MVTLLSQWQPQIPTKPLESTCMHDTESDSAVQCDLAVLPLLYIASWQALHHSTSSYIPQGRSCILTLFINKSSTMYPVDHMAIQRVGRIRRSAAVIRPIIYPHGCCAPWLNVRVTTWKGMPLLKVEVNVLLLLCISLANWRPPPFRSTN